MKFFDIISSIFEIVCFQLFGLMFVDTYATNEIKFNEKTIVLHLKS
jgi:hypothetical protein